MQAFLFLFFGKGEYFSENSDGEAINWSSVVNFRCMQMRREWGLFSTMIEITHYVLLSGNDEISLKLIFMHLYMGSQ